MRAMLNAMRREAMQVMAERASTRIGTVKSYDPNNYTARVSIEPEGNLTGWIPVLSQWVGNGWGMFAPPSEGDQVEVQFQEDDHNSAIACARFFTDTARPLAVESGEFWLVHKDGAFIKLKNGGKLLVNSNVEIDATAPVVNITTTGNTNITAGGNATVAATANVSVTAGGTASVTAPSILLGAVSQTLKSFVTDAFTALFNSHTHTSNASGSPTSSPNQTMNSTHASTTVKGG